MKKITFAFVASTLFPTVSFADHKECDPNDLECVCKVEYIDKSKLLEFDLIPTNADLHECKFVAIAGSDGSISLVPGKPDEEVKDPDDDDDNGHGNDDDGHDDDNPGNGDNSDDGNNGHGNDDDGHDDSNPGKSHDNHGPDKGKNKDKDDNGHGNDPGKYDPSNPGKSKE